MKKTALKLICLIAIISGANAAKIEVDNINELNVNNKSTIVNMDVIENAKTLLKEASTYQEEYRIAKEAIVKDMTEKFLQGKNFYCDSNSSRAIVNSKTWNIVEEKFIKKDMFFYMYECKEK